MAIDADLAERLGDRYALERKLGEGGMGAVYLARDRALDRPVALKVLPAAFADDDALRERFLRETRLAAGFSHPNIVPVHSVEERPGLLAYAMGFVEGETVAERVRRTGPMPVREAVRLLTDVGYALAYAHARGIVHRDLKPDNIMLERETGRALLMDFGIARPITTDSGRPGLTRVGEVVGTPEFMSPEQATGDVVDGRSDLYALGLVAWYAIAGRQAVEAASAQQAIIAQLTQAVPRLDTVRTGLPPALVDAIARCLEKEPADRFEDAAALVEAVEGAGSAAREVPVPVRLLFADLSGASVLTVVAPTLFLLGMRDIVMRNNGNVLVFGAAAMGVLSVRLSQAVQEVRALRAAGFSADAILERFAAIVGERTEQRALRRASPVVVAARRRTMGRAGIAFLVALAAIIAPIAKFNSRTAGRVNADLNNWWALSFFGGLLVVGVAFTVLVRSPFRAGLVETLSRRLWLGWPGRLLLRVAGAGQATAPVVATTTVVGPIKERDRLAQIESRLAALEHWRNTRGA